MQQIKPLPFSASDLICKVHSLYLRHKQDGTRADGHRTAADGRGITGEVLIVTIAGRHRVRRRAGGVPDSLRLDAGRVLEAAGPDGTGLNCTVVCHGRTDHPVVSLLVCVDVCRNAFYLSLTSAIPGLPLLLLDACCPGKQEHTTDKSGLVGR